MKIQKKKYSPNVGREISRYLNKKKMGIILY